MPNNILVTGATGTVGRATIQALQEAGASFKAAVRDDAKARSVLGADVRTVHFDFADRATWSTATDGVDAVFVLGPPMVPNLSELTLPFLDHLKQRGIKRVVYLSALAAEKLGESLPFHVQAEEKLRTDGFDFTVLRPSFFAQNFKNYEWENITERGITYTPAGNGKVGFIDAEDIGRAAAAVLTGSGHSGKVYELTGPETLSYSDAAGLLTEVTGRQVFYPNPSPEEYTGALKAAGAPDFIAPYMITVYGGIANNHVDVTTPHVEALTGRKPTPLRAVLERDFASAAA